jgi:hypothetical protein
MAKRERFAYGSVLEALSRGLYPDKRHVLREFIQNSYDSVAEFRRKHPKRQLQPIEVKIQAPSIFIADHGFGMSEAEILQYRYLGYSQKERAKHAGFRGIGKYSALAMAEKIIVDTSPFGTPKRYQVIIHADRMIADAQQRKNRPLEEILEECTEFSEGSANEDEHYTFVELHGLSRESSSLLDIDDVRAYLSTTAPIPFDPRFRYSKEIQQKLRENIPDFLAVDLALDGEPVYKPYFLDCQSPEFETVLYRDDESDVLAYCWYCQHSEKGQYDPRDRAGLVFRVKNIAVGDGHLSRQMIWKKTPERAFYFFGEIHVLNADVTPSSDRTVFEDNPARQSLAERCLRISSNLNRKAGDESALRRFDEALDAAVSSISYRERQLKEGELPLELKDDITYEIRTIQDDIQKRLRGPKSATTLNRAKRILGRSRRLLQSLRDAGFLDLAAELKFNPKVRLLYESVIEVLREEFRDDPERLERVVRKIHETTRTRFKE